MSDTRPNEKGASAMASEKKTGKRSGGLLAKLLLLTLLLLVGVHLLHLHEKIDKAETELEALTAQAEAQKHENESLSAALEKAGDEEYLKELAREQLDMVSPGEKVFYDVSN